MKYTLYFYSYSFGIDPNNINLVKHGTVMFFGQSGEMIRLMLEFVLECADRNKPDGDKDVKQNVDER